jgi:hypothetical protein
MTTQELYEKVQETKAFLNREAVRIKLKTDAVTLSRQELGRRMDMIHEAERVGIRHLDERTSRKLTKMIDEIEEMKQSITLN